MKTKVIFRKLRIGGDVIAFFPEVPGTWNPYTCESYMHVGQHCASSAEVGDTLPATPHDYVGLYRELQGLGYTLELIQRFRQDHLSARRKALAQ
jgi:hypothetical protein